MKAIQTHPPPPSSYIIRPTTLKDPVPQPFDPELALVCLEKQEDAVGAERVRERLAALAG